jgi:uncharacterized small protein (TIGR04563 family)
MPYYLEEMKIDWRYGELGEEQRRVARKYMARLKLASSGYGIESFGELVREAATELGRDLRGVAVGEDDGAGYLLTVRGSGVNVERFEDYKESKDEGARAIVAISSGGADQVPLAMEDYAASGVEHVEQSIYWPALMLTDIKGQANRLNNSLFWATERAWSLGRARLLALTDATQADHPKGGAFQLNATELLDGPKYKQTLDFPFAMWRELTELAERLKRSTSWVLQRAWLLARPEILALSAPKPKSEVSAEDKDKDKSLALSAPKSEVSAEDKDKQDGKKDEGT